MSVAVDTNVLLHASNEGSAHQARAAELVAQLAAGPELVYLFWPVVAGYLRIATDPRIFDRPLTPAVAWRNIDGLLVRPHVRSPGEGDRFRASFERVIEEVTPRGKLLPDAHLVALMREYGVDRIWTSDRDFRRFDGIRALDPFA